MTFDFPLYNPDPDLTQIYNTNLDPILNSPHKVSFPIQIQNKLKKKQIYEFLLPPLVAMVELGFDGYCSLLKGS